MTVADLDRKIQSSLIERSQTAREIYAGLRRTCTIYDVEAALRIWRRMGWAEEDRHGVWMITKDGMERPQ